MNDDDIANALFDAYHVDTFASVPEWEGINGILATIRAGKVPGVCVSDEVERLRAESARKTCDLIDQTKMTVAEKARAEKAEAALALIGEKAVVDFDDVTVGQVDAVVKNREKYSEWVRSMEIAKVRHAEAVALLRRWSESGFGVRPPISETKGFLAACDGKGVGVNRRAPVRVKLPPTIIAYNDSTLGRDLAKWTGKPQTLELLDRSLVIAALKAQGVEVKE